MTTRRRYRLPGLQVPATLDPETFAFFNALKERLELLSGERGDPEARGVTLRELREAGVLTTTTQNRRSTVNQQRPPEDNEGENEVAAPRELDFSAYERIPLSSASHTLLFLVQGDSVSERRTITLGDLFSMFARLDQETEILFPWSFQTDDYAFDISSIAPRFRLIELAENSDDEGGLPADSAIWEVEVDSGILSIYLIPDDEETRTSVLDIERSGDTGASFNIRTTSLEHNGEQVLVQAGTGLAKDDDEVSLEHLGLEDLEEPEEDRLLWWSSSDEATDWLEVGDGLEIDEGTLRTVDPVVVTPDQLTGDVDDYDPGEGSIVRLSASTPVTITGMVPGNRTILNVGAEDITLASEHVDSQAENRFAFIADITIPPNGSVTLLYDETSERHRCTAAVLT